MATRKRPAKKKTTRRKKTMEASATPASVTPTSEPQLMKLGEVARMLAISVMSARRLVDDGELVAVRFGSQMLRVSRLDVLDFIARKRRERE